MLGHAQRYFLPDILYNKAKVYSWRFNLIQSSVHSFLFTSVDCIKCFWQFTISWWWMMWGVVIEKMCCTSLLCQHNELLLFLHRKQFSFAINMLHLKSNPVAIFEDFEYTLHYYALYAGMYPSSSKSESYICGKKLYICQWIQSSLTWLPWSQDVTTNCSLSLDLRDEFPE